jgi:hypothetical protein
MRLEGALEMAICAVCGCSPGKRSDHCGCVADAVSADEQGAVAESDRRGIPLPPWSLGRALRRQRSRWLRFTGPQRIRRVLLLGLAPALVLAFVPWMLTASSEDQIGPCPEESAPTAESVPAMLDGCGTVEKLDLTDQLSIAVTIYADDENHGGQVDLRRQMGRLMRGLHQVAQCFPTVKTIHADLLAPAEDRQDQYGNAVAGPEIPIVSLAVKTDDLRSFKQDFEWESYSVYAANRYARTINLNLSDVWHRELQKEEEIGDFVDTL